jgi:hypothetical protein
MLQVLKYSINSKHSMSNGNIGSLQFPNTTFLVAIPQNLIQSPENTLLLDERHNHQT